MIIYGSKATSIATEFISDPCSNCGTTNSMLLNVFQKYAHIFWIPFFAINKTAVAQCSHCKQVLAKNQFPANLQIRYQALKSGAKTPLWTFAGLPLLALFIGWIIIDSKQSDAKNAQQILKPLKGDVYEVKTETSNYTLYKVDQVVGDSVFLLVSKYETNKITGLASLKNKGNKAYSEEVWPVTKTGLKSMLEKGDIVDINRY